MCAQMMVISEVRSFEAKELAYLRRFYMQGGVVSCDQLVSICPDMPPCGPAVHGRRRSAQRAGQGHHGKWRRREQVLGLVCARAPHLGGRRARPRLHAQPRGCVHLQAGTLQAVAGRLLLGGACWSVALINSSCYRKTIGSATLLVVPARPSAAFSADRDSVRLEFHQLALV